MLWYIVLAVVYGLYHFVFFSYSSYIFNYTEKRLISGAISYLINLSFWIVYITFFNIAHEAFAAIAFFLLLFFEFLYFFKIKIQIALYIALTFALNLFAKRIAFIGVICLFEGGMPTTVMENKLCFMLVLILSCLMSSNTIALARRSLTKIYLDTILSDNKNIQFLTGIFAIVYFSIILLSFTIPTANGDSGLLIFYILSGTFFLLAFLIFLIYAYHLAKLRLVAKEYKETKDYNEEQKIVLDELKKNATTDHLTGMLSREEISEKIVIATNEKHMFFLVFFDIDGLKIVNDLYGHNEGDEYINQVSQIIYSYFGDYYIGRYGGDEILVLGKYKNEAEVTAKVVQCYTKIEEISTIQEKNYSTSVSYGIVFSQKVKNTSAKDIIALGDKRMYEMKKLRQKHRNSTSTKK